MVDFTSVMRDVAQSRANRTGRAQTVTRDSVFHSIQPADEPIKPGQTAMLTVQPTDR